MYQAIETKYFGPTNSNSARIIAKAQAGKITHNWDYRLDIEGNHKAAAEKLARKFGWLGTWFGGGNAKGDGNVFVLQNCKADMITLV